MPWLHSTPQNEWVLAWQLCALVGAHPQAEQGCSVPVQSLGTENAFPLILSVEETLMDLSLTSEWITTMFTKNHLVPAGNKLLAPSSIMLHLKKWHFHSYKSAVSYEPHKAAWVGNMLSVFTFKYPVDDDGFISLNRAFPSFQTES